jgi:hypothetical protein
VRVSVGRHEYPARKLYVQKRKGKKKKRNKKKEIKRRGGGS